MGYKIKEVDGIIIFKPEGEINCQVLKEILRDFKDLEIKNGAILNSFTDGSRITRLSISFEELQVEFEGFNWGYDSEFLAVVYVSSGIAYAFARAIQFCLKHDKMHMEIVRSISKAADLLGMEEGQLLSACQRADSE